MEVAQLLGSRDLGGAKLAEMLVASGAGARALLQSSSSLWQLAFKRLLWLALLCCLTQQALKGLHWLGSFSVALCLRHSKGDPLWSLSLLVSCQP